MMLAAALAAASPGVGNDSIDSLSIRGRAQALRVYGSGGGVPVIVASGDGGWVHLAPEVAAFLSGRGYFVVGFDSKAYLASFTRGSVTLDARDVPADFQALVSYVAGRAQGPPVLVGVSEGAGLAVLAASDERVKGVVAGVVALGLPDRNELGWRLRDSIIYLTKRAPKEPMFSVAEIIAKLSPLPVVAIHSSADEFVPLEEVRRVMERAKPPKQLWVIEARNHRFSGNELELRRKLLEALEWTRLACR